MRKPLLLYSTLIGTYMGNRTSAFGTTIYPYFESSYPQLPHAYELLHHTKTHTLEGRSPSGKTLFTLREDELFPQPIFLTTSGLIPKI